MERDPQLAARGSSGAIAACAAGYLWTHANADDVLAQPIAALSSSEYRRAFSDHCARFLRPQPLRASLNWNPWEYFNERPPTHPAAARTCNARPRHWRISGTSRAELKRRVVENGDPFVVAQADTPHEIVSCHGHPADHQSMVVGLHLGEAAVGALLQGISRNAAIPATAAAIVPWARLHARQRSGHGALGRVAQTHRLGGAADLRLHSACLRPLGDCAWNRVLSARSAGLDSQGRGMVREIERPLGGGVSSPIASNCWSQEMRD